MASTIGVYVLGGTPELLITPKDLDGVFFEPTEFRLSVKNPDGTVFTASGYDLTLGAGYYSLIYHPQLVGGYEYEGWVKDGNGREVVENSTFEIVDNL